MNQAQGELVREWSSDVDWSHSAEQGKQLSDDWLLELMLVTADWFRYLARYQNEIKVSIVTDKELHQIVDLNTYCHILIRS